jgi:hypothetical protein
MSVRSSPAMALTVRSPILLVDTSRSRLVYRFRGGKGEPGGALAVRYLQPWPPNREPREKMTPLASGVSISGPDVR